MRFAQPHHRDPGRREVLRWLAQWFGAWFADRVVFTFIGIVSVAMFAYGIHLQYESGIEPCPMCIVQRYALLGLAIAAEFAALVRKRLAHLVGASFSFAFASFGAFVAARQSWIQWFPPLEGSCGRDWYSQITNLPIGQALPMFFDATGDCSTADWIFLGGTIANWTFLWFLFFAALVARELFALWKARARSTPT